MMLRKSSPRLLVPAALMFASLSAGLLLPGHTLAHAADGHPARIHEGSCEATGAAADQLTGVGATVSLEGTPITEPEMTGAATAAGIDVSETTLAEALDHLTGEPHAIVLYESDQEMDHSIACGDIGGPTTADGTLAVWLSPTNGGEDQGLALLRPEGDNLTVTIYLTEPGEEGHDHEEGAAAATPSS
jgi:hypothetical protein